MVACADPKPRTQIMVILEADRAVRTQTRSVRIETYGGPGGPNIPTENFAFLELPLDSIGGFPVSHALVPQDGDVSRRFRIEATAFDDSGEALAHVRAISGFVKEQTLVLRLRFYSQCLYLDPCESPDQTCGRDGNCITAVVAPGVLMPIDEGSEDAGVDVGTEGCGSDLDCDDGVGCTNDSCRPDGSCISVAIDTECMEFPDGRCDGESGCQYGSGCSSENCVSDGCETARCEGDTCVRTALCRVGEQCCGGQCVVCGDNNVCTEHVCDDTGCTMRPADLPCDDGMFCNGADQCVDGECTAHAGNPCSGMSSCDSQTQQCTGCEDDTDCPPPMESSRGACMTSGCEYNGMQEVIIEESSCMEGTCVPAPRSDAQSCTIVASDVDGDPCGTPVTGPVD